MACASAPTTPRTIAVVPPAMPMGSTLRLSGRGHVLIRGRRAPIVGAVSMDMITVDVTGLDDVQPGDEVVLIGRQGDESWQQIDAREMAAAIGTIPWEIVCRLGTRIERQYDVATCHSSHGFPRRNRCQLVRLCGTVARETRES